jgi:hypothetical protein
LIILAVVDVSQSGKVADAYEAAYRGTGDEDAMRVGVIAASVGTAAARALFGIGFIVLAIFNNSGKNPARITTWVLAGLGVCCGTIFLIGSAASSTFNFDSEGRGNRPDPEDVQRQVNDALPSWYNPVVITLGLVALLVLLAVIILLALPPANEFFRKPPAVWQPPGGYPQPGGHYPYGLQPAPPPGAGPPPTGAPPPPTGAPPPPTGAPPPPPAAPPTAPPPEPPPGGPPD